MTFRREVHQRINFMIAQKLRRQRFVADVAFDDGDVGEAVKIGALRRIGHRIKDDDRCIGKCHAARADIVGADETSAASDEKIGHAIVRFLRIIVASSCRQ